MRLSVLGVVPARIGSSRLPEKPLHPVLGRPLLEWVWRRLEGMTVFDELVVATDSERIADLCHSLEAPVVLTRPDHASGTDRAAEVAGQAAYAKYGIVVNVQGDEPLLESAHVERAVALVRDDGWEVGTLATPLRDAGLLEDPGTVKVVRTREGRALYFSRAGVPFRRDGAPTEADLLGGLLLRHVGIYAYRRESLLEWAALPPSPLEEVERLEQLRALEAGLAIGIAVVEHAAPGVDTPGDIPHMETLLSQGAR